MNILDPPYQTPPRAISVPIKFQREGIKYHDLSEEEQEEYELQERFYDEETGELKESIDSLQSCQMARAYSSQSTRPQCDD